MVVKIEEFEIKLSKIFSGNITVFLETSNCYIIKTDFVFLVKKDIDSFLRLLVKYNLKYLGIGVWYSGIYETSGIYLLIQDVGKSL